MDLFLIRLVQIFGYGFQCDHIRSSLYVYIGGSGFNQIVPIQIFGYGFQCDHIRSSLYVYIGGSGLNQIVPIQI